MLKSILLAILFSCVLGAVQAQNPDPSTNPRQLVFRVPCIVSDTEVQPLLQAFTTAHHRDFRTFEKLQIRKGQNAVGKFVGLFYFTDLPTQRIWFQDREHPDQIILWEVSPGQPVLPNVIMSGEKLVLKLSPTKYPFCDIMQGQCPAVLRRHPKDKQTHTILVFGL